MGVLFRINVGSIKVDRTNVGDACPHIAKLRWPLAWKLEERPACTVDAFPCLIGPTIGSLDAGTRNIDALFFGVRRARAKL